MHEAVIHEYVQQAIQESGKHRKSSAVLHRRKGDIEIRLLTVLDVFEQGCPTYRLIPPQSHHSSMHYEELLTSVCPIHVAHFQGSS